MISIQYVWLVWSTAFLIPWIILYAVIPSHRNVMLWTSLFTMPFGLTEPLFVPLYWSPPSLFDLASKTGFDIESLIFSFAIGGLGAVLYESAFKTRHQKMDKHEMHNRRHNFHLLALTSPAIIFIPLMLFTRINPIYSAIIAMFTGGVAAMLCRPDLKKKILMGGLIFFVLYFIFFILFNLIYPGLVLEIWNLSALSEI